MQNEAKRTPGPWKACRSSEDFDGPYFDPIDEEDAARLAGLPFTSIQAQGNVNVTSAHDCFEFKAADALLIAAAPDLLKACKLMATLSGSGEKYWGMLAAVNEAVAKAEGGA